MNDDLYLLANYYPRSKQLELAVLTINPDRYQLADPLSVDTRDPGAGRTINHYLLRYWQKHEEVTLACFNTKFERSMITQCLDASYPNRYDRIFLGFQDVSVFTLGRLLFNLDTIQQVTTLGHGNTLTGLAEILHRAYQLRPCLEQKGLVYA